MCMRIGSEEGRNLESHVSVISVNCGDARNRHLRSKVPVPRSGGPANDKTSAGSGVSRIWTVGTKPPRSRHSNRVLLARTLMNFPGTPGGRGNSLASFWTRMGVPRSRRNASTLSHAGSDSQPAAALKETINSPYSRAACGTA